MVAISWRGHCYLLCCLQNLLRVHAFRDAGGAQAGLPRAEDLARALVRLLGEVDEDVEQELRVRRAGPGLGVEVILQSQAALHHLRVQNV